MTKDSTNLSKAEIGKEKSDELFIHSPKGTKPFPFTKKVRRIAKRHPTLIFSIPHEISDLLEIKNARV